MRGDADPNDNQEARDRRERKSPNEQSPTVTFVSDDIVPNADDSGMFAQPSMAVPSSGEASLVVSSDEKTVISSRPGDPQQPTALRTPHLIQLAAQLEGRKLDHFAVEQMIGGGGMGAVFRGLDVRLNRQVAIKVIPSTRRDPETLRRFRLEAQAAARLDHPNIARVFYVGETNPWNYIVFEYIAGVNIRDLVESRGPLSIDDAVFYTRQVAEALQHAQDRDVVHRDIKPSNVLVTELGLIKVVDMGLARDTSLDKSSADATASGVTLGTFDYISPEQARNPRDADVRSDLYSLGCTLYFMLTGEPPFPDGTALQKLLNHGSQTPPDPRRNRTDISDELYDILMKLMSKRPADRYQRPDELVNDLLMLAEVEDLPRSQGPTTLAFSPNFGQQSLLEANLPWLVAAAVLLGSALWLQGFQAISSDFELPEVKFPATENVSNRTTSVTSEQLVDGANNAEGELILDPRSSSDSSLAAAYSGGASNTPTSPFQESIYLRPAEASSPAAGTGLTIVVADRKQMVEGKDAMAEVSLDRALQSVAQSALPAVIEIHGNVHLNSPLVLPGLNLTMRGVTGKSTITVSERLLHDPENSPIQLFNAALRSEGIRWETTRAGGNAAPTALFSLEGTSSLVMMDGAIDLLNISGAAIGYGAIRVGETPSTIVPTEVGRVEIAPLLSNVLLQNSIVRVPGSAVVISQQDKMVNDQVDVRIENSLIVAGKSVFEVVGPTGSDGVRRNVSLSCEQSTFATGESFATVRYVGAEEPLVGLSRRSSSCTYLNLPGHPHVLVSGGSQKSLADDDAIYLYGEENAYSEQTTALCEHIIQDGTKEAFSFAAARLSGWYNERMTEQNLNWGKSIKSLPSLLSASPETFLDKKVADSEGRLGPGYRPIKNLPN